MRIAEFGRTIPQPRDGIPRHGEIALVPAEDDVRECHDHVRDAEGEEHDDEVQVDETEPVAEGVPGGVGAVSEVGHVDLLLLGPGAVGRG